METKINCSRALELLIQSKPTLVMGYGVTQLALFGYKVDILTEKALRGSGIPTMLLHLT